TLLAGEIVNKTERDSFKIAIVEGMMFFLVKRIGEDGHNNFIIITEAGNGLGIVKYMQNNKGPFDFKMVGEDAYNLYRVEHGIPAAPNELNDLYNPYEVELINLVNFKKGCYIGQEVIARLDAFDKVQRKLKRITIEKMVDKNEEYTLFDENDKNVGKITSLAYSKKSDKLLGLAYVRKAYSEEGTKLIIRNSHNNSVEVIVHNLKSKK
ncbi:MAG TPA: tRNA-modifying protein YgfZ, partial [Ignavibacteria bacterium]|nr:tRNA-modifying protein YgfZ [Ignavibacteria bacterium]